MLIASHPIRTETGKIHALLLYRGSAASLNKDYTAVGHASKREMERLLPAWELSSDECMERSEKDSNSALKTLKKSFTAAHPWVQDLEVTCFPCNG